jgi:DNA-binding LacI/PurR family transcriptional regulator
MRYLLSLLDKRVAAVAMNSVAPLGAEDRRQLASSNIPVVLLSRVPRRCRFSTVTCENERGGYLAGAYLARLGHRAVAHLTSTVHHPNLEERWRGFLKAMKQAAPGCKPILLERAHSNAGGFEMAQRLLKRHPEVTAVFAANDAVAFGVALALHAAGVRIPEDMSLIGFDGTAPSAIMHPPLTTISQPIYEIGKAAVEIALAQIAEKDRPPEHRRFDVRLIERESCGPLHAVTSPRARPPRGPDLTS